MDSLTHYLTDPQHVSEQIQSLYERVSRLEQQLADLKMRSSRASSGNEREGV